VLLDLLGHGGSDKPAHATQHRMDRYARQVVAVLDELGVDRAIVGGVSLGANVSLRVAVQAPERVAALLLEMPVLEWATPAAASLFVPFAARGEPRPPNLQGRDFGGAAAAAYGNRRAR
jgi:pimeloyl-ACP methyl ester carboxylesterase